MWRYLWTELRLMLKTVTPAQAVAHELLHAEHALLQAESGVYILNLPAGYRFDEASSPDDRSHVRGYDTMRELRHDIKVGNVIPCDCSGCK